MGGNDSNARAAEAVDRGSRFRTPSAKGLPLNLLGLLFISSGLLAAPPASTAIFGCAPISLEESDRQWYRCGEENSKDTSCELPSLDGNVQSSGWDEVATDGDWAFARKGTGWSQIDRRTGKVRKLSLSVDMRFHGLQKLRPGLVVLRAGDRLQLEDVAGRVIAPLGIVDTTQMDNAVLDKICYLSDTTVGCWMVGGGGFPPGVLAGPKGYLPLDEHLGVPLGRSVSWSFTAPGSGGVIYGEAGKVGWIDSAGRFTTRAEYDGFACVDSALRPHRAGKWGELDPKGNFRPLGDLPDPQQLTPEEWRTRTLPPTKQAFPMPNAKERKETLGTVSVDTFWYTGENRLPDSLRSAFEQTYSDPELKGAVPMRVRIRFQPLSETKASLRMECRRIPDAKADRFIDLLRKKPPFHSNGHPLDDLLSTIGTLHATFAVKENDWDLWGSGDVTSWRALSLDSVVDSGKYVGKAWRDDHGQLVWWDDRDSMVVDPFSLGAQERTWPVVELAQRSPSGRSARQSHLGNSEIRWTEILGNGQGFQVRIERGSNKESMKVQLEDSTGTRIWTWTRTPAVVGARDASPYRLEGLRWLRKDAKGLLREDLVWAVSETYGFRATSEKPPHFRLMSRRVLHRDGLGRIVRVEKSP